MTDLVSTRARIVAATISLLVVGGLGAGIFYAVQSPLPHPLPPSAQYCTSVAALYANAAVYDAAFPEPTSSTAKPFLLFLKDCSPEDVARGATAALAKQVGERVKKEAKR